MVGGLGPNAWSTLNTEYEEGLDWQHTVNGTPQV
jgi:hypothetical protein